MYNYDPSDEDGNKENSQAVRESASSVGTDFNQEIVLNKLTNHPHTASSSIVTDGDLNLSQDFRF